MTFLHYCRLLERVTYKPGWHFQLLAAAGDFIFLEIDCPCTDSRHERPVMNISMSYAFHAGEWSNDDRFFAFVRACIQRTEQHELNEFYRVDGRSWPCDIHATF